MSFSRSSRSSGTARGPARCARIFSQQSRRALDPRARRQVEVAEREERWRPPRAAARRRGRTRGRSPSRRSRDLGQLLQHLGSSLGSTGARRPEAGPLLVHAEHVEDEHRVVGDHGAAGLGDDVGVRLSGFVAGFLHRGHHVVGVLLHASSSSRSGSRSASRRSRRRGRRRRRVVLSRRPAPAGRRRCGWPRAAPPCGPGWP